MRREGPVPAGPTPSLSWFLYAPKGLQKGRDHHSGHCDKPTAEPA